VKRRVVAVDFETEGIARRPAYPPKPVGVAILEPGKKPVYMAWAHPTENNCTFYQAKKVLAEIWRDCAPLFWNERFDLDVAETHCGLPLPAEHHDALFLAFLHDPHATDLHLKPYSARVLGMPPEEQDAVKEWVFAHVPEAKGKPRTWKEWAAHICRAPGKLVGTYAIGDVVRTKKLFDYLLPKIRAAGMLGAYDRERRLVPALLDMERRGVPVDAAGLDAERARCEHALQVTDAWLRRRLKCKTLDVDSNDQLADALEAAGVVTRWVMTAPTKAHPRGQRSTAKENLLAVVEDADVLHVLQYRGKLATSLRTFLQPWAAMSAGTGKIYTTWNQTAGMGAGARSGRLSSSPNLQNVPTKPPTVELPAALAKRVCPLPHLRRYVRPERGQAFVVLDYSQHELRIFAHYEGDVLMRAYQENPHLDFHQLATDAVNRASYGNYERRMIKNLDFAILYGAGVGKMALMMGTDVATARRARSAWYQALPSARALDTELKARARAGEPITTWGGRVYYVEKPKYKDGRLMTFEYKLLNTLIQGSAADCTKEAMVRYHESRERRGQMLLTVHDELVVTCAAKDAPREAALLKDVMESVAFDVPMIAEGQWGAQPWSELK